jgi:hypothetical protein
MKQHLSWSERTPLALLIAAQMFSVFQWYADAALPPEIVHILPWLTLVFAVLAAAALDLVVVTSVMGMRSGHRNAWSSWTAVAAAVFSALVALYFHAPDTMPAWQVWADWSNALLHAAYPVVTLVYAMHLAMPSEERASTKAQSEDLLESVAPLVEAGYTAPEIAAQLGISAQKARYWYGQVKRSELSERQIVKIG